MDVLQSSWRSEVVEAEIRKIDVMSRSQLIEYADQVRCFGWFKSMARKWVQSSHTRQDHLWNDIDSIQSTLQSRMDCKRLFLSNYVVKNHNFKMNTDF